jgi:predicted nucleotidyltransferase
MNLRETVEMHRDEIIKVAKHHGAHNVRVFGSVVLGRDLDVVTEKGLNPRIRDQVLREAVAL